GDDEGRAEEQVEVSLSGEPITVAFNPGYLLDGLSALSSDRAVLSFTTSIKPAVITGRRADEQTDPQASAEYRYLLMPVRLPG
ncbi:MAG TPA: DNA polymerase III subunit beta, partial [Mycobacteriales bacterium]